MKKSVIRIMLAALTLAPALWLCSCNDEQEAVYDPSKPVVLDTFYPTEGGIATKVIIEGSNFGCDVSKIHVRYNDMEAAVISSTGDKIYAITPRKPGEDCVISVTVGDQTKTFEQHFAYTIQTTVTTLCGMPGTPGVTVGNLAQTQFPKVTYLAIDEDYNLFVCLRELDEYYDHNKVVLVNEKEDKSILVIPNTGVPANQPCMLDDGKTVYIPTDNATEYWEMSSTNLWTPRKCNLRRDPQSENYDINFKHSFAMCNYDGFMYTRIKNGTLLRFDPKTGYAMVIATGLMVDSDSYILFSPFEGEESLLYLAYTNSNCIYTYDLRTGKHELYAGITNRAGYADGPCEFAMFNEPRQMILNEDNELFFADTNNHCIRKISRDGIVSTVIGIGGEGGYLDGTPEEALFNRPYGVAIDKDGVIYVGDYENQCVRRLAIE